MKKKKNTGLYIMGSITLAACAVLIAPIVINYLASQLEKACPVEDKDDDDWGSVIVRREKPVKEVDENGEL